MVLGTFLKFTQNKRLRTWYWTQFFARGTHFVDFWFDIWTKKRVLPDTNELFLKINEIGVFVGEGSCLVVNHDFDNQY